MELEHLISHEASWSAILSGVAGTDVPLLRTFLEIFSGNGLVYDSDDINYNAPPCTCYHISENPIEEAPELTPPDQSPRSRAICLQEKAARLWAR